MYTSLQILPFILHLFHFWSDAETALYYSIMPFSNEVTKM